MTPGNLCTCINEPDAVRGRAGGPLVHDEASDVHGQRNADAVTEAKGQALLHGADNAMLRARCASCSLKDLGPAAAGMIAFVGAALE